MKRIGALLWIACVAAAGGAGGLAAEDRPVPLEWSFAGQLHLEPGRASGAPRVYDELNTVLDYRYRFLGLVADLSLLDDERYTPDEPWMLGRGFLVNNAGLELDSDLLSFRAGRFTHRDVLDTPYSLFISSENLPAVQADLVFRGGPFTYESRWLRLTYDSAQGWPERGASYKVFALRLGNWRFGLQDSAVYTGRSFDLEYFLSPMPAIFTQMVTKQDRTPWQEGDDPDDGVNDNSISGLFVEWSSPEDGPGLRQSYWLQWLVDDISLDFLIPWFLRDELGGDRRIANKMAWSAGGRWELPFGRLGFHHAGATKYTFAASSDANPYGYTYYPATDYELDGDPTTTLDYRDNYLGYRYGENNLAFLVDLVRPLLGAEFRASLEYVVSGSKSPANPWHDAVNSSGAGRYTQMLDDPVLEHTLAAEVSAAWPLRSWTFFTRLRLGGVFNRLGLEAPVEDPLTHEAIFRPQAGDHALLYGVTVGARYTFRIGKAAAPAR